MEPSKTTPTPIVAPGRWHLDLYIVGLTVVGKIHQIPRPDDEPKVPGVVRPHGNWQATGMREQWGDTDLGQHPKIADARKAVEEWHRGK